jgi:hypothetical protein
VISPTLAAAAGAALAAGLASWASAAEPATVPMLSARTEAIPMSRTRRLACEDNTRCILLFSLSG